jgi:hypothetical protein
LGYTKRTGAHDEVKETMNKKDEEEEGKWLWASSSSQPILRG